MTSTAQTSPQLSLKGLRAAVHAMDDAVDAVFAKGRGKRSVDLLFYSASALGDFGLIWLILAGARALRGRPADKQDAVRTVVSVAAESIIVNAGIKSLFGRKRPVRPVEHPLPFRTPITSSFPSGHATAAFCAATLLSENGSAPLYFGIATIVAASRIHVRIHHASDVIAGAAVGCALGYIATRLAPLPKGTEPE